MQASQAVILVYKQFSGLMNIEIQSEGSEKLERMVVISSVEGKTTEEYILVSCKIAQQGLFQASHELMFAVEDVLEQRTVSGAFCTKARNLQYCNLNH